MDTTPRALLGSALGQRARGRRGDLQASERTRTLRRSRRPAPSRRDSRARAAAKSRHAGASASEGVRGTGRRERDAGAQAPSVEHDARRKGARVGQHARHRTALGGPADPAQATKTGSARTRPGRRRVRRRRPPGPDGARSPAEHLPDSAHHVARRPRRELVKPSAARVARRRAVDETRRRALAGGAGDSATCATALENLEAGTQRSAPGRAPAAPARAKPRRGSPRA